MNDSHILDIDGSILEGGGQILRMSIVFSALLQKPVRVFNIRANRKKPGLASQHLTGLICAKDICQGRLDNAHVGSTEVLFYPGNISSGNYYADCITAGSVTLVVQVALPLLIFGSGQSQLTVKGGTNADMAPPLDFYLYLWKPFFNHFFGLNTNILDVRRGFYPRGGGEIRVDVSPVQYIRPIELIDRGSITSVTGHAIVAGAVRLSNAQIMANTARDYLRNHHPDLSVNISTKQLNPNEAFGHGSGIYLFAHATSEAKFSSGVNGNPKTSPQESGVTAATQLSSSLSSNACTDEYTQDQLVLFMALAKGKSSVKTGPISLHTKTAIHVAELMTNAKFNIIENGDKTCTMECEGIGFVNKNCSRKSFK